MLEHILELLPSFNTLRTSHVCRKGNKVVDHLENQGANGLNSTIDSNWGNYTLQPSKTQLLRLAMNDMQSPRWDA